MRNGAEQMKKETSLIDVARRVVWFEPPEKVLANKSFFLCHVMMFGTLEDVLFVEKTYSRDDFRNALLSAPFGLFERDPRSKAYWQAMLDVASLPQRTVEAVIGS